MPILEADTVDTVVNRGHSHACFCGASRLSREVLNNCMNTWIPAMVSGTKKDDTQ